MAAADAHRSSRGGTPGRLAVAALLRDVRTRLETAGFEDAAVEAETLVGRTLAVDATWLYANPGAAVGPDTAERVARSLRRRLEHEPLAYITGIAHFYGREFEVDPRVLIPRPETELLVERALTARGQKRGSAPYRVADIGTGSGVLAITLALELSPLPGGQGVVVHAVDASAPALEVARANARRHGVEGIVEFHLGDLASPLAGRFDAVVANLPYIRTADLTDRQPELRFEPRQALDGGAEGMRFVGPLIDYLPRLLAMPGTALLEIDPPIAAAAARRAGARNPGATVTVLKDMAGLDRVLEISAWCTEAPCGPA